jgi:tripartite-type tricarboxylate transporter receptor subunit TctC
MAAAMVAIAAASAGVPALAQVYPERTVEIVVPSTPGATADVLGRVLAEGLTRELGQRFIVVNKAGAGGVIGTAGIAQAKPDGYSLLHGGAVSLTVLPLTDMQAGYDHKSFDPICQTFKNDQVIVVRPDSHLMSAQDLVRAARTRPGGLNMDIPAPPPSRTSR